MLSFDDTTMYQSATYHSICLLSTEDSTMYHTTILSFRAYYVCCLLTIARSIYFAYSQPIIPYAWCSLMSTQCLLYYMAYHISIYCLPSHTFCRCHFGWLCVQGHLPSYTSWTPIQVHFQGNSYIFL